MPKLKTIVATTPEDLAIALGLSRSEAIEWRVQHALLHRLKAIVDKHGFTHAEVATRSGASRTRVTAILNGDLDHVSSDLLIRILTSLGYQVRVSVVKSKRAAQAR
jgi:predicted XRE-type DNA-binding protein